MLFNNKLFLNNNQMIIYCKNNYLIFDSFSNLDIEKLN